jgi:uncharacterized protein
MTRVITPDQWREQPWKNGRGVTYEIARWPVGDGDFDVRASVAEVTMAGAFSTFPGHVRYSVLLAGGPIGLAIGDDTRWLRSIGDAAVLDGDAEISALLPSAAARLLNLIVRPGIAIGRTVAPLPVRFVFALEPHAGLERWHARVFDPPELVEQGPIAWIA